MWKHWALNLMPKKKLTAAQKETLKRWIAEGAEYQPHWSLIAATRPALPPVKNGEWVKTPIDAFILAKLEAAGLRVVELSHPWKRVPLSLLAYQLQRLAGLKPRLFPTLTKWGIPINLWDAMRVIAVKS